RDRSAPRDRLPVRNRRQRGRGGPPPAPGSRRDAGRGRRALERHAVAGGTAPLGGGGAAPRGRGTLGPRGGLRPDPAPREGPPATTPRPAAGEGVTFMGHLRNWLFTGLLVLAPSAITIWVLYRFFNWVDNLLGRYLRFAAVDYRRIPGLGLLATVLILLVVG